MQIEPKLCCCNCSGPYCGPKISPDNKDWDEWQKCKAESLYKRLCFCKFLLKVFIAADHTLLWKIYLTDFIQIIFAADEVNLFFPYTESNWPLY